jgi:hypothetical protein
MSRNQAKDKQRLVQELRKLPIIQIACTRAGVSRATFYRWRKDDPEFGYNVWRALGMGQDTINDLAESKVINRINNDDWTAITYWLGHNHKVYGKSAREHEDARTGSLGNKIMDWILRREDSPQPEEYPDGD